jgi:multiple sugar transport system permease protein
MDRMKSKVAKKISLSLFFIPAIIPMIIFVVFPILQTIYMNFLSPNGEFVGLNNYLEVLNEKNPQFAIVNLEGFPRFPPWGALIHNLVWIAIHLPITTFFGLALAIILRDVKGASIIKSVIFVGMVMPMIVGGIIIRFMFTEGVGIVNGFFDLIGLEGLTKTWIAYPDTALFALIFGSVWLWSGFSLILYSAGLAAIPKDFYEAAKIDGASPFRVFFRITLPLLKPVTIVVVAMTILWELKIFDLVYMATMGGPGGSSNVLALTMYIYWAYGLDYVRASVVAVLLTILTLVIAVWLIRYLVKR